MGTKGGCFGARVQFLGQFVWYVYIYILYSVAILAQAVFEVIKHPRVFRSLSLVLAMGSVDLKGVAKVSEVDLAAAQETTPVTYRDGDEDDSALALEEEQGVAALLIATPGFWLVDSADQDGNST